MIPASGFAAAEVNSISINNGPFTNGSMDIDVTGTTSGGSPAQDWRSTGFFAGGVLFACSTHHDSTSAQTNHLHKFDSAAQIDISGLGPGNHTITVQIYTDTGCTAIDENTQGDTSAPLTITPIVIVTVNSNNYDHADTTADLTISYESGVLPIQEEDWTSTALYVDGGFWQCVDLPNLTNPHCHFGGSGTGPCVENFATVPFDPASPPFFGSGTYSIDAIVDQTNTCASSSPDFAITDSQPDDLVIEATSSALFSVTKTFSDGQGGAVDVSVTCDDGDAVVIPPLDTLLSHNETGDWIIENFADGTTCSATEADATDGYIGSNSPTPGECTSATFNDAGTPSCTLTNRPTAAVFSITKVFSDDNPNLTAEVSAECTDGGGGSNTIMYSGTDISTGNDATADIDVTYFLANTQTTCNGTELDNLDGYTWTQISAAVPPVVIAGNDCFGDNDYVISDASDNSCSIYNEQDPVEVVVNKSYTDNSGAAVDITLFCDNAVIAGPNPTSASPGNPAVFSVSQFPWDGTDCWVTEELASDYYLAQSTCGDEALPGMRIEPATDQACELVNAPTRATFEVNKIFSDDAETAVEVSIDCTTGLIPDHTKIITPDMSPWEIKWVIIEFNSGELDCTVTETPVSGYLPHYSASIENRGDLLAFGSASRLPVGSGCHFTGIVGGEEARCEIFNELQEVDVEVVKQWFDEFPEFNNSLRARVFWECSNVRYVTDFYRKDFPLHGNTSTVGDYWRFKHDDYDASMKQSKFFYVLPNWDIPANQTVCEAYERIRDSSVESDHSDCDEILLAPGIENTECTITNTRIYEGIPTLSQYGLALMALLMLAVGLIGFRRFA